MWFRNLIVYRITAPWRIEAAAFEASLARNALQPCGSLSMESRGWVCPRDGEDLLYTLQRQWLIALGADEKLLPATVIRQVAEERAAALEKRQAHPVGRKQMRDLRIQVTDELLPRALTRRRRTRAWIDTANNWLAIDVAAAPKADEFIEVLRRTHDGLPTIVRLEPKRSAGVMMTHWVETGEAPDGFTIDRDLELQSADGSKAIVRYSNHSLDGRDIQSHIRAGKTATRLGMTWHDRISFVLTDQMQIKRLDFLDVLRTEPGGEADDPDEQFEVDFALMTGELSKCLADLAKALGGART
ncbi:MAG: recombination-associated protein RdgC [Betaproteobacteria bacterium]|nr:MAG: recombination-associated protein RdgC [Betaproteobacteria bacterium]